MAKKSVNKSELIREYFKSNPTAGLTDIACAISEQGYPVSPTHVSQALKSMREKRKKGRGRPVGSTNRRTALTRVKHDATGDRAISDRAMQQLSLAAEFCKLCGGVDSAIDVLNKVKQIAAQH